MATHLVPTYVCGPTDAAETLLFIHGWPDDASLWERQVAHLSSRYRCITVTLPHFAGRPQAAATGAASWGYDFAELADLVAVAAHRELRASAASALPRVNLIIHDWGAVVGFTLQLRHPGLVDRIVALDVGPPIAAAWSFIPAMVAVGFVYQYWLILGFLLAKFGAPGRYVPWACAGARAAMRGAGERGSRGKEREGRRERNGESRIRSGQTRGLTRVEGRPKRPPAGRPPVGVVGCVAHHDGGRWRETHTEKVVTRTRRVHTRLMYTMHGGGL